jgi:hypothetical protein
MSEFKPIAEGWSNKSIEVADPAGPTIQYRGSGPVYHYFAGICGLGGRFRSLCARATIDVKERLDLNPLEFDKRTKVAVCRICAEKVMIANQQSKPKAPGIL